MCQFTSSADTMHSSCITVWPFSLQKLQRTAAVSISKGCPECGKLAETIAIYYVYLDLKGIKGAASRHCPRRLCSLPLCLCALVCLFSMTVSLPGTHLHHGPVHRRLWRHPGQQPCFPSQSLRIVTWHPWHLLCVTLNCDQTHLHFFREKYSH